MHGNFLCFHRHLLTFQSQIFMKILSGTLSELVDPDQDRQKVGPDLGPNCLQKLSTCQKSLLARKELTAVKSIIY